MTGIADELRDLLLRLRFIESCIPLLTGVFELEYVVLKNQSQHHQNSKLSSKLNYLNSDQLFLRETRIFKYLSSTKPIEHFYIA